MIDLLAFTVVATALAAPCVVTLLYGLIEQPNKLHAT